MTNIDHVHLYAASAKLDIKKFTVFVEGTGDVEYFTIAAKLELAAGGPNLLGDEFAIVAAGEKDNGGVDGLRRQMTTFRALSSTYLKSNGAEAYRFLALFDNDMAGRRAKAAAMVMDAGMVEFRDVLCLLPVLNAAVGDAAAIGRAIAKDNEGFRDIDWEIEDMLSSDFVSAFLEEHPSALINMKTSIGGHVHRELTRDGKARLLAYTRENAIREDVSSLVTALHGLRCYTGIR